MKKKHVYNRLICLGLFMPKPESNRLGRQQRIFS